MNKAARTLLEAHFDTVFTAPEGIKKLRELILTLAMQGKLVAQDPNDPPASQLLKEIEAEKKRLVKEGKIKAPKPLTEIKPEEVPYALPQGWEWARIGEVCSYIQRGKGPVYADSSSHRVISQKCVRWNGLNLEPARFIEANSLSKYEPIRFLKGGDLLWNSTGTGTIGRACLVPNKLDYAELVADSHVTVVRILLLNPTFLWRWIQSPIVQDEIESVASGTTNQIELNTSTVINHLMPLPPLPEQHRIVAKIDQLMARCDELEKLRGEREQKRRSVHAAALKQLLDAQTGDRFADAWRFITLHFGELYAVRENVTELRKAILQLAVMGKLVPQNPNDPPASQLLKEIEAEKKRLVKEGKIKAPKPLPEIKPEEVPYALPQGWEWATLGQISLKVSDGFHHTPKKISAGIKYISATHIYNGRIDWDSNLFVSEKEYLDLDKKVAQGFGDILIVNRGAGCGDAAIVDSREQFCFQNAAIVGFSQELLCGNYLLKYLHSSCDQFLEKFIQGGAQPMLSNRLLATHLIAIPPMPEQHRIVAKIDQLMSLCGTLEQQTDAATRKQTALLDAVMAQV